MSIRQFYVDPTPPRTCSYNLPAIQSKSNTQSDEKTHDQQQKYLQTTTCLGKNIFRGWRDKTR